MDNVAAVYHKLLEPKAEREARAAAAAERREAAEHKAAREAEEKELLAARSAQFKQARGQKLQDRSAEELHRAVDGGGWHSIGGLRGPKFGGCGAGEGVAVRGRALT